MFPHTWTHGFTSDKRKSYDHNKHSEGSFKRAHNQHSGVTKKSNQYFYEYCKVRGHSIQHCFKLHEYPDGKGKKVVAHIQADNTDIDGDCGGTGLSSEQLNNLLALMSNIVERSS